MRYSRKKPGFSKKAGLLERAADYHPAAPSDPAEARLLRKTGLLGRRPLRKAPEARLLGEAGLLSMT
jgi:hypothetical protein